MLNMRQMGVTPRHTRPRRPGSHPLRRSGRGVVRGSPRTRAHAGTRPACVELCHRSCGVSCAAGSSAAASGGASPRTGVRGLRHPTGSSALSRIGSQPPAMGPCACDADRARISTGAARLGRNAAAHLDTWAPIELAAFARRPGANHPGEGGAPLAQLPPAGGLMVRSQITLHR